MPPTRAGRTVKAKGDAMSTDNTAVKAYTLRHGTLWRTDDDTPVTAVSVPTRRGHGYMVNVKAIAFSMSGNATAFFERIATFHNVNSGALVQTGATVNVLTTGTGYTLTLDTSGTDIRVRITGALGSTVAWQIAVDVLEGGPNAANAGFING